MSTTRDDAMSHTKAKKSDGGALGPDQGTPRKRADVVAPKAGGGDGGALGPDQGTPRSFASEQTGAHAEFGGGKHEHSPHMPTSGDSPKV